MGARQKRKTDRAFAQSELNVLGLDRHSPRHRRGLSSERRQLQEEDLNAGVGSREGEKYSQTCYPEPRAEDLQYPGGTQTREISATGGALLVQTDSPN